MKLNESPAVQIHKTQHFLPCLFAPIENYDVRQQVEDDSN